eukprot:s4194_g6.t1
MSAVDTVVVDELEDAFSCRPVLAMMLPVSLTSTGTGTDSWRFRAKKVSVSSWQRGRESLRSTSHAAHLCSLCSQQDPE